MKTARASTAFCSIWKKRDNDGSQLISADSGVGGRPPELEQMVNAGILRGTLDPGGFVRHQGVFIKGVVVWNPK